MCGRAGERVGGGGEGALSPSWGGVDDRLTRCRRSPGLTRFPFAFQVHLYQEDVAAKGAEIVDRQYNKTETM